MVVDFFYLCYRGEIWRCSRFLRAIGIGGFLSAFIFVGSVFKLGSSWRRRGRVFFFKVISF